MADQDWRSLLRQNFTHVDKLADFLELDESQRSCIVDRARFVMNVPRRLAEKMVKRTLDDPILRQFVPLTQENHIVESFRIDPVGDVQFQKTPKLLQKYQGRALLVCTSACAMHCRYCFRQNYDYETHNKLFVTELEALSQDPSISEVILSGGDPLSLSDETLSSLLEGLAAIPHIRRVRFHSRFPVGIPERINDVFLAILSSFRFSYWFIVHVNHPRELDEDVLYALKRLVHAGIPVLNQAVLLRGVNDSVEVQKDLCERLVDHAIFPYYLHQLDQVQGAHHFEVDKAIGLQIIDELTKQLPGYAVPKYVKEICGQPSKTLLLS